MKRNLVTLNAGKNLTKIIAAISLLFIFTQKSFAQSNLTQPIRIPFTQTKDGHIIIEAKINGIAGRFFFDTGAGVDLITKKFADKITDLEATDHFYTGHRGTGEALKVDLWNGKLLQIGDFNVPKIIVAVYDVDFPLDGLISLTSFKDNAVTIDYENIVLIVESNKSLNDLLAGKHFTMPIQITNDRNIDISISTTIRLENKLVLDVGLDTGAGDNVFMFNSQYMDSLRIDKNSVKSKLRPSTFDPAKGNTYYFTTLSKLTDLNNNVTVSDFKATFIEGFIHEGNMSLNWIGSKITIDIPKRRLVVPN